MQVLSRNMRKLVLIIAILLMCSCTTTRYVEREVPIETTKIEYVNREYRDSFYIHDSIDRYIEGDTVYLSKYKYVYRYITNTDTIVRTDSIEVPIEIKSMEVKEVNSLKNYQVFLMCVGILPIIVLLYKIINYGRKILRK